MRRVARISGALLIAAGVLTLAWAVAVWRWQDPFTALYTGWEQRQLATSLDKQLETFEPAAANATSNPVVMQRMVARAAKQFRLEAKRGQAIGRITIGRIGLNMVLVNGTDAESLKTGPGRDGRSYMPGENRLVYIAGHRTTYLAPFSRINDIRNGDYIRLQMPYATFVYRTVKHRIVAATDMSVLRSPRYELLELQACHPRFFATQRWIVYARLVSVRPRGMPAVQLRAAAVEQPRG